MKKFLLLVLFSAGLVASGWYAYHHWLPPPGASGLADRTRETAAGARDQAVASARTAGGQLADAAVIAVIKAKYVMDRELSAFAIGVQCRHGEVTLTGTATSPELIARAATLARETRGVSGVEARLTVKE